MSPGSGGREARSTTTDRGKTPDIRNAHANRDHVRSIRVVASQPSISSRKSCTRYFRLATTSRVLTLTEGYRAIVYGTTFDAPAGNVGKYWGTLRFGSTFANRPLVRPSRLDTGQRSSIFACPREDEFYSNDTRRTEATYR